MRYLKSLCRGKLAGLAALTLVALYPAAGFALQPSLKSGTVMEAVARLQPGEFLWTPEIAPEGPVLILISLTNQRAVVYRNGVPIGVSTVSTGKDGHVTPTGIFTILQKRVDHKSNLYDDAPMPYMQRLTWDGIALHAGNLPGHPASHGCIRLPLEFAKRLYGVTKLGLTVVITNETAVPRMAPEPGLLDSAPQTGIPDPSPDEMRWEPEASPVGPVSVVVSAADKRVVILRNGREIGSASVAIAVPVEGTSAYSLRSIDANGWQWLRLFLPGQDPNGEGGRRSFRGKFTVSDEFRKALVSVLRPGATVVVTGDSLRTGGTAEKLSFEIAEPHP